MAILKHLLYLGAAFGADAFRIYAADDLNNVGEACVSALTSDIACNSYIRSFMALKYRGSLENVTLTDDICVGSCSVSLRKWFNTVAEKCTSDEFRSDTVPMQFGGNIWQGWNETCIKDPKTKKYCNDIINEFPKLGLDMAKEDLCHPCYRRRLAIMQSSQYSIYNEYYKENLERVYKTCGGSGPTEIPPPLRKEEEPSTFCLTSKYYTTKDGDSCDSISKVAGVSGALLYMGNQEAIGHCHNVPAGLKLCLPTTCKTYYVKSGDTCLSIEMDLGIQWESVRKYNKWIDRDCNNLQGGTDFYGKSICIGPLGSTETLVAIQKTSAPGPSSQRSINSGNTPNILRTLPPEDTQVAKGTTIECGSWHVVKQSDTCNSICQENNACQLDLFFKANPSLDNDKCKDSLVPGVALCVTPISGWYSKE